MKKKILSIAVISAAIFAASCQKENLQENNASEGSSSVFTATIETGANTKTTVERIDDYPATYKTKWENTDQISINGVTYTATPDVTNATKATFTKVSGEDPTGPFNAYFPANLYNNGTPTLPANVSETWVDGKYNMPMYATSETTSLSFKNLCGVLKITVTNAQLASVKCITVSSTNKAVSGEFTVSDNAAVLTDASNTANTVTVTYTDAVVTDATGKVFYVAIPAQTYQNLSIAVSNGTAIKVMTTKKNYTITVARNTVYPIAFNGQPTTGSAERTNGNVNWVQLWAGGPKFAEYNVGVSGASPKPEDYGGYYCWGRTKDKDGSGSYEKNAYILSGETDTATKLWGNKWRMPTDTELQALLDNCDVEKTAVGDIVGLKFTGRGIYASNSLFLPAAGYFNPESKNVLGTDLFCYYWTSIYADSTRACYLDGRINNAPSVMYRERYYGYSVRAVLAE